MDKSTIFFSQLLILGAFICLTTAVSLRHKRNVIAEYHWPDPNPEIVQFPHEKTCHYYYLVLSEEDITVNKCPDGELFDYIDHKCSRKETARCWSRHFGKIKHHHIPLKSKGQFRCPYAWGKYPDINDCTKYYVCLSGKVKHKKCAPFEHFDKVSRKCVAAIDGVCADKTDVVDSDYKCQRAWGSFPFSKDCSKYYECLEKKPSLRTCPTDTLFHERKGKCLPTNHVHCGSRHNPYSKKEEAQSFEESTHVENPKVINNKRINTDYASKEKETEPSVKIASVTEMSTIDPNSIVVERMPSISDAAQAIKQPPKDINTAYTSKEKETKSSVETASVTKMSTIDPNSIIVERIPSISDAAQTTTQPQKDINTSKEKETKSNVKVASETKMSTIDPNSIVVERKPSISEQTITQPPKDLTTGEFSSSNSQNLAPLVLDKTKLTDLPSKQQVSIQTESIIDVNTEIISVNDTDENTDDGDDDSGITDEFIEISTSETKTSGSSEAKTTGSPEIKTSGSSETKTSISTETKTPSSSITQDAAVESTQNTKAEMGEIKEQLTTAESLQATSSDECSPKDQTCITEESGRIIRCPSADGLHPYPEDERRFLICEDSKIRVRYCSGETIFNVRAKKCIGNIIF